jgi:cellulose synthase/poly-beta-1,6-N-acetylglucosamine synthase-like glycosyltransferase
MQLGLCRLTHPDSLLLTTDADSTPHADWLSVMTAGLAKADVVAGKIVRRCERPSHLQDRIEAYYDALFAWRRRIDPVSWEATATHHCTGGANLGIRADAYRTMGGFLPLASGEDARLLDDASRAGLRVRRDAASVVYTSDRRTGRAVAGLALALRQMDTADARLWRSRTLQTWCGSIACMLPPALRTRLVHWTPWQPLWA